MVTVQDLFNNLIMLRAEGKDSTAYMETLGELTHCYKHCFEAQTKRRVSLRGVPIVDLKNAFATLDAHPDDIEELMEQLADDWCEK